MKSRFPIKLTVMMILFALTISFSIAALDHLQMRKSAIKNDQLQVMQIEDIVKHSIRTLEKTYVLFGSDLAARMEAGTQFLMNQYEQNPNVDAWDLDELRQHIGFDIYIVNEQNVITHSSFEDDIGLDFNQCCRKLAQILNERRAAGSFFTDSVDIEQSTGEIKKYSYMATPDRKYLLQLGFSLQDGPIFEHFNFLRTIEELVSKYPTINEIRILNLGGLSFGEDASTGKIHERRREAFEQTLQTRQTTEFEGTWNHIPVTYRYVHYVSEFDSDSTQNKVLEIIYNKNELQTILRENKQALVVHLLIVFIVTIAASIIITRWVARPMYLAFHDSLTGLKNRAAFDEMLSTSLIENKGILALLMIDLDNFKQVNDSLGHDKGDQLLKMVALNIRSIARKEDMTIRLGGDEFVMIMPNTNRQEVEETSNRLITAIKETTVPYTMHFREKEGLAEVPTNQLQVTVSIGIALAPEHGVDPKVLSKKADIALYISKEQGKDQVQFYSEQFKFPTSSGRT